MEFFDVVRSRQSIRKFLPKPVEPDALRRVLAAAVQAPSAGNLQAFQVFMIDQPELKRRLAEAAGNQSSILQAPVVLVFCADPERAAARYGARGELFCIQDATIACAYAQLAATAVGLSSVWLGVAFEPESVQEALSLGNGLWPIVLLPIGYAAEQPARTTRRDLRELCRELPPEV